MKIELTTLLVTLLGGGLLGAFIQYRKLPAEREGLVVTSLHGGIESLNEVINSLRAEQDTLNAKNKTLVERVDSLEVQLSQAVDVRNHLQAEIEVLRSQLSIMNSEKAILVKERDELVVRLDRAEQCIEDLQRHNEQ